MSKHYQSSGWAKKSLRDLLFSNYSLLELLFGTWRYKFSRTSRYTMINHTQRHQINSRFL